MKIEERRNAIYEARDPEQAAKYHVNLFRFMVNNGTEFSAEEWKLTTDLIRDFDIKIK